MNLIVFGTIFVAALGACVGSFLNVVIYRVPEGQSIVHPPSHCPHCQKGIQWYDNLPVLSWILLGARCRNCKAPISMQYPLIEALTGLMFAGLFLVYFASPWHPRFAAVGPIDAGLILVAHLFLLGCLLAATVIDARLYIIPLSIPWTATIAGLILLTASALWQPGPTMELVYAVEAGGVRLALGGVAGLALAVALLHLGVLPRSFSDEEEWFTSATQQQQPEGEPAAEEAEPPATAGDEEAEVNPEAFLAYPYARREMVKEMLFLVFPIMGAVAGMKLLPIHGELNIPALQVFAGALCGYLIGGGVIWITRVLGTLAFGKEAMGLGDVHLLAAVGAVLGPIDPLLVFFIAPFMGLAYVVIAVGASRFLKGQVRIIPYGPYLALATVVVMVARDQILALIY